MASSPIPIPILALVLLTAACDRTPRPAPARDAEAATSADRDAGYLAPPVPVSAIASGRDDLDVSGLAAPHAVVRVTAPEGEQRQTLADGRGAWSVKLPNDRPRLYAISALLKGRTLHAEGALVTAPGALSPAVLVRAGDAALPLASGRPGDIATVDYDPEGAIAVAGAAPAHAKLALTVDGSAAAMGQADGEGRYALLAANRRLSFGPHRLEVRGPGFFVTRNLALDAPAPLAAPYQAWRTPQGWRVEWALNGGGVQTTLILAPG